MSRNKPPKDVPFFIIEDYPGHPTQFLKRHSLPYGPYWFRQWAYPEKEIAGWFTATDIHGRVIMFNQTISEPLEFHIDSVVFSPFHLAVKERYK